MSERSRHDSDKLKDSRALVAAWGGRGVVLLAVGKSISEELCEVGSRSLEDMGLYGAPDGLSVWEGSYVVVVGAGLTDIVSEALDGLEAGRLAGTGESGEGARPSVSGPSLSSESGIISLDESAELTTTPHGTFRRLTLPELLHVARGEHPWAHETA